MCRLRVGCAPTQERGSPPVAVRKTGCPISPLTQNGVVVLQGDPFEGMTGNSVLPKYLLGSDANGRELWRFPAKAA